ncbi:hypothetical protein M5689_006403 [Euphorbia peplus]|nr:hypothetical protein M5689_006400 [Euphorbia peplus]WCJ24444.1 hypothetical protein M5689_006403 [Euphorbia peplus]
MAQEITVTHIFSDDARKKVSQSRVFTSRFLDDEVKSTEPISLWLSAQNWNSFVSLEEFIYPNLVTEFYKNLHFFSNEEDVLHSVVGEVEIEVSRASISQVIGIDDEGIIIGDDGSAEGFSEANWARPDLSAKETYATWLSQHQRWAHYLTTNVFLPKAGGVNCVSNRERVFMWHLVHQKKINLPAMLIRQMKNVTTVSALAYGSLLTRLFEAASVVMSGEGVTSRSTVLKMHTFRNLSFDVTPKKNEKGSSVSIAQKEIMDATVQKGKNAAKKGKGKKGSSKLVLNVEKVAVSEPLPMLVQTKINVEPSGKIVAEKPKDVLEKEAQDAEEARLAEKEKAAEAEKVARVVALAEEKRKKKEAEDKLAAEREIAAKAKADAKLLESAANLEGAEFSKVGETSEEEDNVALSSRIAETVTLTTRIGKKAVAKRRVLRKKDFVIAPSAELEEPAAQESEPAAQEPEAADKELSEISDEEDVEAPLIEELSEESESEDEEVLQGAKQFVENVDNENFIDNVLLNQGRNPGERDASETLFRMAHLYAEPISTFDPNASEQVISSPALTPHPSPSLPSVTEVSESQNSIPLTTSTSEVVPPPSTLPSGSYSEVNLSSGPIFTDSISTSTTSSLSSFAVFPSIGITAPSPSIPLSIPFSISSTLPSCTNSFSSSFPQIFSSPQTSVPPLSTSGHTPPVCDPLTTSSTPSGFAGLSSNYDFLRKHLNREDLDNRFGSFGFMGRASGISEAGGAPSVEELRRMGQSGSDDLLNRFAGLGQRSSAADMYAQGIVLQELHSLKAQNLQLMTMLQMQDPSVYIRNLSTLHLATYDELYKLRELALTLPSLDNIALASSLKVNENLEILTEEVKEANEHYEAHEKMLPSKIEDLQSTANHILREVKSSAQGSSSSGAAKIVYDITPDLNNRLSNIESAVSAQNAQIAELTELLKVMHNQAREQEKTLHNCYRFVRGQTYIQNEHLTAAVYANNRLIKLLLEDVQKQRPMSGQTFDHMKTIDDDFRRRMDLINTVRPTPVQYQTALNVQQKLKSQGALGVAIGSGQTGEKSGQKRSSAAGGSSVVPPPQKKSRNL